jgi:hypothetical protein
MRVDISQIRDLYRNQRLGKGGYGDVFKARLRDAHDGQLKPVCVLHSGH